ncbi:receptor-type tyrosine-protein phosphatase-like N isoform X2 [Protopterus annectens]|uniref:receptor-type tyrosine-protein phosphatase-like N isoform X2 n=1 Tax=Protopterus annectens TaxID=7888 RepID=UPI001CFA1F5F|nr:receptor-type tyrosine-protein phosphatase-like N isoform X2 [Protopterus annectens]
MKPTTFRAVLCLFLVSLQLGNAANRYGCLFEKRLCSRNEVCIQDGLFGHCLEASSRNRIQYHLSADVLQRLREVLKQLMLQGLSWKDDLTQYIISQEMDRALKFHPWRPTDQQPDGRTHKAGYPSSKLPYIPSGIMFRNNQMPSPLVQQYLPYMVYSTKPEFQEPLGMEESLLEPYSYHKFGYQDVHSQMGPLKGHPLSVTYPPARRPEDPSLSGTPVFRSKTPYRANPVPSYLSQKERERKIVRDLIALYLSKEKQGMLHSQRDRRLNQDSQSVNQNLNQQQYLGGNDFPDDYTESYWATFEDNGEDLLGERNQRTLKDSSIDSVNISNLKDPAVQKLAVMLADYGFDLRKLNDQQLASLSILLQLLQPENERDADKIENDTTKLKRVTEGEMQHWDDIESDPLAYELSERPKESSTSSSQADHLTAEEADFGKNVTTTERSLSSGYQQDQVPDEDSEGQQAIQLPEEDLEVSVQKKSYTDNEYRERIVGISVQHPKEEYGYILTDQNVVGSAVTFRIRQNNQNMSALDVAKQAVTEKSFLETQTGLKIIQTGTGERSDVDTLQHVPRFGDPFRIVLLSFIAVACIAGILIAATVVFCLQYHAKQRDKKKMAGLGPEAGVDATLEYQELCRQHMAVKSPFSRTDAPVAAENSRVSSVSSQFSDAPQASPSSHSSTPSWCEEPVQSNMDISTGHMILAYMEDHLRNKDRCAKEWEALCAYQAEPNSCAVARSEANIKKNRNADFVPYDHARVKLKADIGPSRTDYINASPIIEHDPRMPAYIATQGPLSHTIADFWQMVWENGCTVIVMLSPLLEDGVKQCDRYWPDEGSSLYHVYEVNLVSEHIWCEDFLVRSFYLKNVHSQETRTLTQFHFLSWPAGGIPTTTRPLLDFRRKVNKCYRGRSCPIIVHCSDGAGRTGTYILIDMVLNRMAKGVKEIDIAASLEHIRDQRPGMVRTKDQFEFALTAVAEEVNAILKALPQ